MYDIIIIVDIRSDVGHRSKRAEFQSNATRKVFITKQDVANVRTKVNDLMVVRNKEDSASVEMFVSELSKEAFDPILLYKRQHHTDSRYPSLSAESFVLALQTEYQREMYQQHVGKVMCIDATHGTNQYGFKLITVMVADHYGQGIHFGVCVTYTYTLPVLYLSCVYYVNTGYPIAWCIADQENTTVIQIFFKSLKERSPNTNVHVLMSDDGNYV